MVEAVMSQPEGFHILFVDDSSPDGTADLIRRQQENYPGKIHLEERTGKLGLGTAYIHGFKWALKNDYAFVFEMDCDFSHNPNDLGRLLKPVQEGKADLAIGSRYTKQGKVSNWPLSRVMLSYFASVYVRMILFLNVKDTTAGFMCYRAEILSALDLDGIQFKGYAFQIEMKYAAKKHGFRLIEIPITFIDRQFGESKMSGSIVKEALIGVWKMRKMKI